MLPANHYQQYEQFRQGLEQLHQTIAQGTVEASSLKAAVSTLQDQFQSQILILDNDELAPEVAHQVQSYQVEIDKQLRLLSMDVMFLQAARQAATLNQRQEQVGDRARTLIRYCEVVLGSEE